MFIVCLTKHVISPWDEWMKVQVQRTANHSYLATCFFVSHKKHRALSDTQREGAPNMTQVSLPLCDCHFHIQHLRCLHSNWLTFFWHIAIFRQRKSIDRQKPDLVNGAVFHCYFTCWILFTSALEALGKWGEISPFITKIVPT